MWEREETAERENQKIAQGSESIGFSRATVSKNIAFLCRKLLGVAVHTHLVSVALMTWFLANTVTSVLWFSLTLGFLMTLRCTSTLDTLDPTCDNSIKKKTKKAPMFK